MTGVSPEARTALHAHIERELTQTRPLSVIRAEDSVIRAEDFERLRSWASQRCVRVD